MSELLQRLHNEGAPADVIAAVRDGLRYRHLVAHEIRAPFTEFHGLAGLAGHEEETAALRHKYIAQGWMPIFKPIFDAQIDKAIAVRAAAEAEEARGGE